MKRVITGVRVLILSLVGALALLVAYSAFGIWRLEQTYPPLGRFVEVSGVRLHYVDAGTGPGPVLVLLHGASTTLRDFTASIVEPLARTRRVIAFDRPGYGYSERPAGDWPSPAEQARLIHAALVQLGVERPVIVGHSWSGSVVLAYLLAYPDTAGGVLLAGAAHAWDGGVDWVNHVAGVPLLGTLFARTLVYPAGQLLIDQGIQSVFAPNAVPDGYRERTAVELTLRPVAFQANAEDMRLLSDFLREQSQRYADITQPLLLITGDADDIVPSWNHSDRLIKQAPRAELVVLPGVGHAPHHVEPERVAELIDRFAGQVTP